MKRKHFKFPKQVFWECQRCAKCCGDTPDKERRILLLSSEAEQIGEIVKEEVGQEKYVEALPYFASCSSCGRIYTTKAYEFLPKEKRVLYVCEGMEASEAEAAHARKMKLHPIRENMG